MSSSKEKVQALVTEYADACIDPSDVESVVSVVVEALIESGYMVVNSQGVAIQSWEGQ